jgi:hypothetical protein
MRKTFVCVLETTCELRDLTDLGLKGILKINRVKIFECCSGFILLQCSWAFFRQRVEYKHILNVRKQEHVSKVPKIMTPFCSFPVKANSHIQDWDLSFYNSCFGFTKIHVVKRERPRLTSNLSPYHEEGRQHVRWRPA